MTASVNYVIGPFEGNINARDIWGLTIYLQETKEIYKESNKINISVSNAKYIIDRFIVIANRYG